MMQPEGGDIRQKVIRVEGAVAALLRVGVATSLAIIVAGMLLSALHHPREIFSHAELMRLVTPGAAFPHSIAEVVRGVAGLRGKAVTTAGILILLFLPILRVALTGVIFVLQKDRIFVFITGGVLGLLLLSLVLGKV